jgi:predicted CoA-binding protein
MTVAKKILLRSKVIAVVGISRYMHKEAGRVPMQMQMAGYRIIPVNPYADVLLGEKVYRRLEDIPHPVDLVNVFRPSAEAPDVVRQAAAIGAKAVWLQLGISSDEAERIAKEAGLDYVENRCIAVEMVRHGLMDDRRQVRRPSRAAILARPKDPAAPARPGISFRPDGTTGPCRRSRE